MTDTPDPAAVDREAAELLAMCKRMTPGSVAVPNRCPVSYQHPAHDHCDGTPAQDRKGIVEGLSCDKIDFLMTLIQRRPVSSGPRNFHEEEMVQELKAYLREQSRLLAATDAPAGWR